MAATDKLSLTLHLSSQNLPLIVRLRLKDGDRDYVLKTTRAGKLLLNRRDEVVAERQPEVPEPGDSGRCP
ncbi:MAG: hypothetical protein HYT85_06125 [candidate division NC10 bacterium]|nr:hypothetical protein [candidate division NC10 bacterium]MBI2456593.1 hypothetical protein [candidate division NC10 bacterium]MBI2563677.1 hypothetical protein [candidate division NC10 bacterium]